MFTWPTIVNVTLLVSLFICSGVNNGVYRAGFTSSQEAYDKAVREVFEALDRVEGILSGQRYLTGSQITEADVRLYTSLVRFDPVYVGHFKVSEYHSTTIFVLWHLKNFMSLNCCYVNTISATRKESLTILTYGAT